MLTATFCLRRITDEKITRGDFALLPVLAFAASPNHTAKSTQTKSVKTAVKSGSQESNHT